MLKIQCKKLKSTINQQELSIMAVNNMAALFRVSPLVRSYSLSLHRHSRNLAFLPVQHHRIIPARLQSSAAGATNSGYKRLLQPVASLSPLYTLKPYLRSELRPILSGWVCGAISVYSLTQIVPKVGTLSSTIPTLDALTLRNQAVGLGVLLLVRIVASYLQQAFLWDAALNCAYKIRIFVYDKVLQRELSLFEGENGASAGDVAYRLTAEASDVADTVHSVLNTTVPSFMQLFAMGAQMILISPMLSLITALVIPSMALVVGYLGEKLRGISNKAHLSTAALSAYLNEVLPSFLFVKANNAELCENIRFQLLASADLSATLEKKKMKVLIPHIVQAIYFGLLFTLCTGSAVVSRGSFDFSAMVSFITSLYLLIEPIQGIGKAYNELKQGEPAIERLFTLTRFTSQVIELPDSVVLDHINGEVKFSGVSFKYVESTHSVLNKVDFHIKAGETIALVGPSGGGKTTIAKLLLRLYDPLCGCIFIDGHDIRKIQLENLRRHIGLVSQDTMLFSGTVAENIGYRDLMADIDMEKVEFAAKTANADEFIETLPDRYQTNIGPRGSILSGGQKQRLAIARAIYQNPSILILDEATSALDSRSELLVRQALERLTENRTVLVIAHRLETVLMAKRILHLNDGKLEELSRSSVLAAQRSSSLASMSIVI
ncbi:OLC1v1034188C1 [Oldenlandia corymbosa var. corymbosa]|uniref:OLC1v1034188C1 n=1 Tax=Oldenlandia corymbosa var. corymbosa TaxID=529605 RepID=A0AAV1CQS3_OLDCO|nr:OLC1v1034188C1 [Oldenlandia corymbosa var. corymbosa]